jgi:hypothetical protein
MSIQCRLSFILAILFALSAPTAAHAALATASISEENGLPSLSVGGGSAMESHFVFWGKDWRWAQLKTQFARKAAMQYTLSGRDDFLHFDLSGEMRKASNSQFVWEFVVDADTATPDAVGGGIAFKFDLTTFEPVLGEPTLLPGNSGWSWGRPGGPQVEMRFDPPLASVHFERDQKSEVRALIYDGAVPQGRRQFNATLTLSGDAAIMPTETERYGLDDSGSWPTNVLDWATSPVDLSFLNAAERPAGKHGFLKTAKDELVFADGAPARFWGTNVAAFSLFTTNHDNVRRQAHRLSALGFNLVRIHHIDSDWVKPNIFGKGAPDTQNLDETSLEELDWWIKCLEDEGIYIWLDLHDGRQLKAGDGIDDFAEISKGRPSVDLRGYNYINASVQSAMRTFNQSYLDHVNRFTGLRYKDDPGLVTLMITNENDLTNHFGNRLLPNQNVPSQNTIYMSLAAAFAEKNGLPKDKTWHSWEQGPAKLFLNDLEHAFNEAMVGHLKSIGARLPVVTTSSWGKNPLNSLPSLTDGDIIDVHAYGSAGVLETDPLYAANLTDWVAASHVVDLPLSVSEWNVSPFPVPDRHVLPLYMAGVGDLQNWNALLQFAYSQQTLNSSGKFGNWDAFNDPGLIATLPAAALLFRRHDAHVARDTYVFAPSPDQLFNQQITPDNAVALRTAAETSRLVIALPPVRELPWLKPEAIPAGARVISDPREKLIANDTGEAVSDTGELRRNWAQGTYTIDTPRTQAAMGWIGGKRISLTDVDFDISTGNAAAAVQSLDDNPVSTSASLLISLGAPSIPDSAAHNRTMRSEPVVGKISLRAREGLIVYKRDSSSGNDVPIPATYSNGRYEINLTLDLGTYWLLAR